MRAPNIWYTASQIRGFQANLTAARRACIDGATVEIDLKLADRLIEVCKQARWTEHGCNPPPQENLE